MEPRMNNKLCEIKVNDPPGWIMSLKSPPFRSLYHKTKKIPHIVDSNP